jgi:hypothetical protein
MDPIEMSGKTRKRPVEQSRAGIEKRKRDESHSSAESYCVWIDASDAPVNILDSVGIFCRDSSRVSLRDSYVKRFGSMPPRLYALLAKTRRENRQAIMAESAKKRPRDMRGKETEGKDNERIDKGA